MTQPIKPSNPPLPPPVLDYATPEPRERQHWLDWKVPRSVWIPVLAVALLALGVVLLPAVTTHEVTPNRARCASNLKQIGLALMMYANDNGDQLPPSFAELLLAEDLTSAVFVCPEGNDVAATGADRAAEARALTTQPSCCSYVYCGAGLTQKMLTADHVLAYERAMHGPSGKPAAGMNVLYGDGHVQWASQQEAQRMIAELQAGHNPPRPPPK